MTGDRVYFLGGSFGEVYSTHNLTIHIVYTVCDGFTKTNIGKLFN